MKTTTILMCASMTLVATCLGCSRVSSTRPSSPTPGMSVQYKDDFSDAQSFLGGRSDVVQADEPYVLIHLWHNPEVVNQRAWDIEIPKANIVGYTDYMIGDKMQPLDDHKQEIPIGRIEKDLLALLSHLKIEGADVQFRKGLTLKRESHNKTNGE